MALQSSRELLFEPMNLLLELQRLFPDFIDETLVEDIRSGDASLHTVMIMFASSFDAKTANPSQLAGLATLIDRCITVPDRPENAIGTCFLEHLPRLIDKNTFEVSFTRGAYLPAFS
ncbi:hypothetical protein HED63_03810 [Ochrobactrum cytisi]|nr:hypothetical protein [Brucella cytisi]